MRGRTLSRLLTLSFAATLEHKEKGEYRGSNITESLFELQQVLALFGVLYLQANVHLV